MKLEGEQNKEHNTVEIALLSEDRTPSLIVIRKYYGELQKAYNYK